MESVMELSEKERRLAHEQALASARVEGFEPTIEFLTDWENLVSGRITRQEFRDRNIARAIAANAVAVRPA